MDTWALPWSAEVSTSISLRSFSENSHENVFFLKLHFSAFLRFSNDHCVFSVPVATGNQTGSPEACLARASSLDPSHWGFLLWSPWKTFEKLALWIIFEKSCSNEGIESEWCYEGFGARVAERVESRSRIARIAILEPWMVEANPAIRFE